MSGESPAGSGAQCDSGLRQQELLVSISEAFRFACIVSMSSVAGE